MTGRLELAILAGAESKAFLVGLTEQLDRWERLSKGAKPPKAEVEEETDAEEDEEDFAPKKGKTAKKTAKASFDDEEDDDAEEGSEEEDDEPAPKKKAAKKAAASFDEDDDAEESEEDSEEDEEPAPKKKAKKLTVDDVNDACKARAMATGGKKGRAEVLAILKKKFKTESVSELKPEQYAACVAAMAVDE